MENCSGAVVALGATAASVGADVGCGAWLGCSDVGLGTAVGSGVAGWGLESVGSVGVTP